MISRPLQITIFLLLIGVLAGGIYMNRLQQGEERRDESRTIGANYDVKARWTSGREGI